MANIVDIWNKSNEIFIKWVEEGAEGFVPKGCMFLENEKGPIKISLGVYSARNMGVWFDNKKDLTCFHQFASPRTMRYTHPPIEQFQDLFYDLNEKNKIMLCLLLVNPLEEAKEEVI